jgi:hypothetical protein
MLTGSNLNKPIKSGLWTLLAQALDVARAASGRCSPEPKPTLPLQGHRRTLDRFLPLLQLISEAAIAVKSGTDVTVIPSAAVASNSSRRRGRHKNAWPPSLQVHHAASIC